MSDIGVITSIDYIVSDGTLQEIANGIRTLIGSSDLLTPADMCTRLDELSNMVDDLSNIVSELTGETGYYLLVDIKSALERLASEQITVYMSYAEPDASLGEDGDIYIVRSE